MKTHFLTLLTMLAVLCMSMDVQAEVFMLNNGGRIEGQWLNREAEEPAMVEIALTGGGRLTLSSDRVARVIVKSAALLQYEADLPSVADTEEGHWAMAERCRKEGLKLQREIHLRRILEISPDHSDARHALGFSRVDGKWIKPDEWLTRQGYVRHKGSWRLPQEIELDAQRERQKLEEQQWRKQLKVWRTSIVRGRNDSAAALKQIRGTDSAYAIAPLVELLGDKDEPKPLKLVYIEVLGRFQSSNAAAALLERVMTDPNLEIRERSITALQKKGTEQALAFLTHSLTGKDNHVVNEAAWALGKLGDPRAIFPLINAVTTKHKIKIYPGGRPGGINAGMGSGGGGLTMGGRPKIIEQEMQNRQVLSALTALTPAGINFGFNKQAWKNWWALEQSEPGFNLRRDL